MFRQDGLSWVSIYLLVVEFVQVHFGVNLVYNSLCQQLAQGGQGHLYRKHELDGQMLFQCFVSTLAYTFKI